MSYERYHKLIDYSSGPLVLHVRYYSITNTSELDSIPNRVLINMNSLDLHTQTYFRAS